MPGNKLYGVWFRPDSEGDVLFDECQRMDVNRRASLFIEKEKLEYFGPDPDEIEEVLDARYELFIRKIHDAKISLALCLDTTNSRIYILDVISINSKYYSLYKEACEALNLINPVRERR